MAIQWLLSSFKPLRFIYQLMVSSFIRSCLEKKWLLEARVEGDINIPLSTTSDMSNVVE